MSDKSSIQWTDATWNPVTGCVKVSPGCAHCYAETVALRFWATQYPPVEYGYHDPTISADVADLRPRRFTDVQCHEDRLDQPLRWTRPRMVFVNSMSDLFHEDVPTEFIDRVFATMILAPRHTFQVLTKRAERLRDYMAASYVPGGILVAMGERMFGADADLQAWPPANVWTGVSAESQRFADERIPLLLRTPSALRFVSYEPALGPVDFVGRGRMWLGGSGEPRGLDWVIVGGESGRGARPFDLAWARAAIAQCRRADVPIFVKQLGAFPVQNALGCLQTKYPLRSNKGGEIAEWPADLRVREFPRGSGSARLVV